MGLVAQVDAQWDEADRYHRKSLKLKESVHNLPGIATTYNQLGIVAQSTGRPNDAEQ